MDYTYTNIEVPFHFRHICWFCGEPANKTLNYPINSEDFVECLHRPIALSSCQECLSFAKAASNTYGAHSIWECRQQVKKILTKHYRKDLAIGKNWTKKELANSGFEGGNFEGFARSAWFIFEVAQQRVNFSGWPIWCEGKQIESRQIGKEFIFDGVSFTDVNQAIDFYCMSFDLHKGFFKESLNIIGVDRFSYAIRFCRQFVGTTPNERRQAINMLSRDVK